MPTLVTYTCQSCGGRTLPQANVQTCNYCERALCAQCRKRGLCPHHLRLLTANERDNLSSAVFWSRSGVWLGLCLFGGLLFFVPHFREMGLQGPSALLLAVALPIAIPLLVLRLAKSVQLRMRVRISKRLFPDDPHDWLEPAG